MPNLDVSAGKQPQIWRVLIPSISEGYCCWAGRKSHCAQEWENSWLVSFLKQLHHAGRQEKAELSQLFSHGWGIVLCRKKSIGRAELWKGLLRKDIQHCFAEGIHTQLSAVDKLKLDFLLDQSAVCEVGGCTSSTRIVIWLLQTNSFSRPSWLTNTPCDCCFSEYRSCTRVNWTKFGR